MTNLIDHRYEISVSGGDTAYADTIDEVVVAVRCLKDDRGIMGTKAIVKDLDAGKVILNEF